MPVHIEGKDLPIGKYDFHRYMTYNGEKQKVNTYHIEKTRDGYKFFEASIKIDDEIRRIELKKANMALIWSTHSRLGLLYTIENHEEEEEEKNENEANAEKLNHKKV
tara:strand:+ start:1927 stop:2247 length:321 start_codon:yes stop_codon:yes gene_type:complete